jgi:hypothetical protein
MGSSPSRRTDSGCAGHSGNRKLWLGFATEDVLFEEDSFSWTAGTYMTPVVDAIDKTEIRQSRCPHSHRRPIPRSNVSSQVSAAARAKKSTVSSSAEGVAGGAEKSRVVNGSSPMRDNQYRRGAPSKASASRRAPRLLILIEFDP